MSATIAPLVPYFMATQIALLLTTIAMLSVILANIGNIRHHREFIENRSTNLTEWRKHDIFLSSAYTIITGMWCFFCLVLSDDTFMYHLYLETSMGNAINLICRNFVDDKILTIQLVIVGLPYCVPGVPSYADYKSLPSFCSLAVFFLTLFSIIRYISGRLCGAVSKVTEQLEGKEAFGIQLHGAVESMSHGLLMFDDDMRCRVINRTTKHILLIHDEMDCSGKRLGDISAELDLYKPYVNRVGILEDTLLKCLQQGTHSTVFQVSEQQFVDLSIRLGDNGGCVLVIEDVSQRVQYQNRINQLARFDDLTGLCNRNYFNQQTEKLVEAIGPQGQGAMIFFDLDDFKRINDMLGHEAGDFILTNVGNRIREYMPKEAIIGRYGGDEFVVFVEAQFCDGDFDTMAEQLIVHMTKPMEYNQKTLRFGSSLGIARYPQDADKVGRLLKLADFALYKSKKSGKNTKTIFTAELEIDLHNRIQMEHDLAKAVKDGSLELHFQPILSMDTHRPAVFEALTRWTRSGSETVPAAVFIPLAEDLGLINEIGKWTILEACKHCRKWPEDTSVAVSISPVQFQMGPITDVVCNALDVTGTDPTRLELEISETTVVNDMNHAISVLETLSELGVVISLKNFGSRCSSLSFLHKLPLDKLKISKSFIDEILENTRSQTLLKGIIAMGKALDFKVVIEGIESQAQFDLLRKDYPIDFAQGSFFSRALPPGAAKECAERFDPKTKIKTEQEHTSSDKTQVA